MGAQPSLRHVGLATYVIPYHTTLARLVGALMMDNLARRWYFINVSIVLASLLILWACWHAHTFLRSSCDSPTPYIPCMSKNQTHDWLCLTLTDETSGGQQY